MLLLMLASWLDVAWITGDSEFRVYGRRSVLIRVYALSCAFTVKPGMLIICQEYPIDGFDVLERACGI